MDDAAAFRKPAPLPTPNQLDGVALLLVDDDPLVARASASGLRKLGATVTIVHEVPSAIRSIQRDSERLDAIILDYVLLGGDAIDVVHAASAAGCACGIILVTGQSSAVARSAAARLRVDDVLLKPVRMAELVCAIERARRQKMRRAAPVESLHVSPDEGDLAEQVLQAIFGVLRRAGLERPYRRQALESRARGYTDEGTAEAQGVTVPRMRARVGEALRDVGAESGFELVRVIADRLADDLAAYASGHSLDARKLLADVVTVVVPPVVLSTTPKTSQQRRAHRVHRTRRGLATHEGM